MHRSRASRHVPAGRRRRPQFRRVEQGRQRIAERLATLTKCRGDYATECFGVYDRKLGRWHRFHPDDARRHLRRRIERSARHIEELHQSIARLQHDREAAVGLAAGRRHHAVDDFLLQHEVLVELRARQLCERKQQRRRDVVRQIADQRSGPGRLFQSNASASASISVSCCGANSLRNRAARSRSISRPPNDRPARCTNRRVRAAWARSDLDDVLAGTRIDRIDDAIDDPRIVQEVSAEAPASTMWCEVAGAGTPQYPRCGRAASDCARCGSCP